MERTARNVGKKLIKICVIILFANLPFLTVNYLIGGDVFYDSFDHPESYIYVKSNNLDVNTNHEGYLIIQKTSHQDFSLSKGDIILYLKEGGSLVCQRVYCTAKKTGIDRYYTLDSQDNINENPVYDYQVIGKIVRIVDDNVWNGFSLKIWDMSINNLNAAALFTNK